MDGTDFPAPSAHTPPDRLNGWKDIAAYLGKSVRTVERWERRSGLPVHRLEAAHGEIVFAFRHEIDTWRRSVDAREAENGSGFRPTPTAEPQQARARSTGDAVASGSDPAWDPLSAGTSWAPEGRQRAADTGRRRRWTSVLWIAFACALIVGAFAAWRASDRARRSTTGTDNASSVLPVRFDVSPEAILSDGRTKPSDRVPIVVYSTALLRASEIDPTTVRLSGVPFHTSVGSGEPNCATRDVNADGLDDLVCEIDERALMGGATEKVVRLEARTTRGRTVRGQQFLLIQH